MTANLLLDPLAPSYLNWLVDRLRSALDQYGRDARPAPTVPLLRELRRQIAHLWGSIPQEQLATVYHSPVGEVYRALVASGFHQESLTEEEVGWLKDLAGQAIAHGLQQPAGLKAFLGLGVYYAPGQIPLPADHRQLPDWLSGNSPQFGQAEVEVWGDRPWNADNPAQITHLPRSITALVELSCRYYSYRGVQTIKNPFDWALYPLLLWDLKPRTLIEIGSHSGGSALWFGDLLDNFAIDGGHVYSIDLNPVTTVSHPRVTFLAANGRDLGQVLTPTVLEALPRPWLVIEDADHSWATTIAVLEFFDSWLQPGDYVVVEDSLSVGHPLRALREFLDTRGQDYEIDRRYCDFFGQNVTWCLNGFLKKLTASQPVAPDPARVAALLPLPPGENDRFSEFQLNWILNCLAVYPELSNEPTLLGELGGIRQQFFDYWLNTPAAELEAAYQSPVGQVYRQFIASPFLAAPLGEIDCQMLQNIGDRAQDLLDPAEVARAYLITGLYPEGDRPWRASLEPRLPAWLGQPGARVF